VQVLETILIFDKVDQGRNIGGSNSFGKVVSHEEVTFIVEFFREMAKPDDFGIAFTEMSFDLDHGC